MPMKTFLTYIKVHRMALNAALCVAVIRHAQAELCYSCAKAVKARHNRSSLRSLVAMVLIYYMFDICILRCVFSGQPVPQGEAKSTEWTICSPQQSQEANWMCELILKN